MSKVIIEKSQLDAAIELCKQPEIKKVLKDISNNSLSADEKLSKDGLQWLMNKYSQCSDRYMEVETFLMDLATMSIWKRIILSHKICKFWNKHAEKYNF